MVFKAIKIPNEVFQICCLTNIHGRVPLVPLVFNNFHVASHIFLITDNYALLNIFVQQSIIYFLPVFGFVTVNTNFNSVLYFTIYMFKRGATK